jgi:hypothetical protein
MHENSPFSERSNDMQGFALHPPEALPLDSGREHSPLHPEYCAVNYNVSQLYYRIR